jgi:uncharacterized protein (DUF342 family)
MGEKEARHTGTEAFSAAPGGRQDRPGRSGRLIVDINRDGLSASLTVFPPAGDEQPVTPEEARERLGEAGVIFGIDEEALARAVAVQTGTSCQVAFGQQPVQGQDGRIELRFKTDFSDIQLSELANGRVDYYNLNLVQNVEVDQVLAVRTPPGPGEPGKTVTGDDLRARPGKEARLFAGKNTRWSDDGTTLVATAQGHVLLADNKVEVHTVFEQPGNVDFSTGNLDCLGSVLIRGDVKAGFTVKAAGDVEIMGTIDGGTIIADGNIQVRKGILGHGDSKVAAGGSLMAKFIENSRVEAGKDIVADAVMHSQVLAGENVIVGGKKGLIVGGMVRAGRDVMAKTIGSYLTTPTNVEAGVRPELRSLHAETAAAINDRKVNLEKIDKAVKLLTKLEKAAGKLPEEKRVMLSRLQQTLVHLHQEVESLQKKLTETEAEITAGRGRVGASGSIHPGVVVTIGRTNLPIREERRFALLCVDQGEIRTFPYR